MVFTCYKAILLSLKPDFVALTCKCLMSLLLPRIYKCVSPHPIFELSRNPFPSLNHICDTTSSIRCLNCAPPLCVPPPIFVPTYPPHDCALVVLVAYARHSCRPRTDRSVQISRRANIACSKASSKSDLSLRNVCFIVCTISSL